MVAPHHVCQVAVGYAGLDFVAVKSAVALHVKAIGTTGHWPLGIDRAGVGGLVQQRADDGPPRLADQGAHVAADGLKALW